MYTTLAAANGLPSMSRSAPSIEPLRRPPDVSRRFTARANHSRREATKHCPARPQDEEESFRAFMQKEWDSLTRTAYLLTGDRDHSEDLVQTALEKTHRR
ncbi:hypothetical protein Kisp01_19260 [Kineosporia sp. NBRC 101677]|nr:hypothetical protein Kisp01_19260 [Kineosporia sp. NBRC 101677]